MVIILRVTLRADLSYVSDSYLRIHIANYFHLTHTRVRNSKMTISYEEYNQVAEQQAEQEPRRLPHKRISSQ